MLDIFSGNDDVYSPAEAARLALPAIRHHIIVIILLHVQPYVDQLTAFRFRLLDAVVQRLRSLHNRGMTFVSLLQEIGERSHVQIGRRPYPKLIYIVVKCPSYAADTSDCLTDTSGLEDQPP